MFHIRQRLARRLRALAERLAPAKPAFAVEPAPAPAPDLEFIETAELAAEIYRRNDVCLLAWGRRKATTVEGVTKLGLDTQIAANLSPAEFHMYVPSIIHTIHERVCGTAS